MIRSTLRPLACGLALAAALLSSACAPPARGDAFERPRLEAMLAKGEGEAIRETFRRDPGRALPFIDHYLEGALKMTEKEGSAAAVRAGESYRTGIGFAQLADEAFGETIFSAYAKAFAGWSPPERQRFREGQRLYKAGAAVAKERPAEAIAVFKASLAHAEALGDWWGQAMAHGGIASAALAAGSEEDLTLALDAAVRAAAIDGRLRLQEDRVDALLVQAAVLEKRPGADALVPLREAWTIARKDATVPPPLRSSARERLLAALDRAGLGDEAAAVRRE